MEEQDAIEQVNKLSQNITFSEEDVESWWDYQDEIEQELFDNEIYLDDTEEMA